MASNVALGLGVVGLALTIPAYLNGTTWPIIVTGIALIINFALWCAS